MTTPDPDPKPSHHHGNLREALINAGIEILQAEGMAGLTLRKCAALVGVSHAAPAHHFAGLPGLLDAIAARGFTLFADAMEAEAHAALDEPRAQLKAICFAYLDFAKAYPALFDLMFHQVWALSGTEAELGLAGLRAYNVLALACAPFVPKGTESTVIETQVWSLIHGYSALTVVGKMGGQRPVSPLENTLALLDALVLQV